MPQLRNATITEIANSRIELIRYIGRDIDSIGMYTQVTSENTRNPVAIK
jgi:hypothetical protein